jgi:ribosome-associated translation inhibitor RaiA
MRIEVSGHGFEVTDVVRTYAESRVWLAVQRASRALSWVGARLMSEDDRAADGRVVCQLDVWLRDIGLITVRHIDVNPYVGIDCAAVRLEQAIIRKLREAGRYAAVASNRAVATRPERAMPRRYALVIAPCDAWSRLSLIPWLRTRHGIDHVQTVSLGSSEWDALVAGELKSPRLERLKDRLALAQLSRPHAIVVVGGAVPQLSCDERPQVRPDVERVVNNIRSFGLPIEVIGVWVNEHWTSEDCLIESEELPRLARNGSGSDEELYAGLRND